MRPAFTRILLLLTLALAACRENTVPPAGEPAPASTQFTLHVSGNTIRAKLALTELELATGLMHTKSLPADEGILFLYRDSGRRAFWMVNVPYDIDAGYFTADGTLDEVVRLRANDATPVPSDSDRIRYVLEAPAGWFSAHGLKRGARLSLAEPAAGITRRGFPAAEFIPGAKP